MLEAVIFDVDGTLLDTERIYMQAMVEAGAVLHYPVTDALVRRMRGLGLPEEQQLYRDTFGADFPCETFYETTWEIAEERIGSDPKLVKPGVLASLALLRERGVPLGVASMTEERARVALHLEKAGILGCFDAVVSGEMVTRRKPAPDAYLLAASLLGADPAHCLAVEDSAPGVRAAHDAGMRVVLVPDGTAPSPETVQLADHRITSLTELPPILRTLLI